MTGSSKSNKRNVSQENVDIKGLVKRDRINNQTVFDEMLVKGFIELPQHEAAHLFMEALSISGTSIQSVDIEAFGGSPFHKKGNSISERRMIFSNAYRSMTEANHKEEQIKLVMRYCHNPYEIVSDVKKLKAIAVAVHLPLRTLAKYYKIDRLRDPRSIIRSQVYRG